MEADALASHSTFALSTRLNSNSRRQLRRDLSTRSQKSQKLTELREARQRRSPPLPVGTQPDSPAKPRSRPSPTTAPKPLLPATERRSGNDGKHTKSKKESEGDKWDIAPDGGSAGREGRQFTVANVGNNGKIYLRPTVRPANQRYPQPHFVFPVTPPSTAGLDAFSSRRDIGDGTSDFYGSQSQLTPLTAPSSPELSRQSRPFDPRISRRSSHHRRAVSESTIQDPSIARESDIGGFKVVISKPRNESRARTTEDLDADGMPLLQVSIPTWKLGTPQFTTRGTPIIRGSSYAPTEDVRSSNVSFFPRSHVNSLHNTLHPQSSNTTKPSPTPHITLPSPHMLDPTSPRPTIPSRATCLLTDLVIEPGMFDSLTFKPFCDDRSIVRYSSNTGAVTAAAPSRLVAEITSPSFLDYELLSDFFLTFRAFLETSDLLRMLIARLKWALRRDDETGMVVRVRTFVAIRHWILNYFVDDFVVDYHLRVTFCDLLNEFVNEISQAPRGHKTQIKILSELKKCWRRVCSQYWDGPEFDSNLAPEFPIAPGGIAGHRNPSLDPSFWETKSYDPPCLGLEFSEHEARGETSFYLDVDKAGHINSVMHVGERPSTPPSRHTASSERTRTRASPTSIASLDVISCSFPIKSMRIPDPATNYPMTTHPVDPSSVYANTDPIAPTPRALTGKRVRPHKRNNSIADSLREHTTTEKVIYKNAEFLLALPYAGSLVRGNLLPPGQAFVDVMPPSSAGGSRQTTVFQPSPQVQKDKSAASAVSGAGMRKLLGSVSRALSNNKGQAVSPTQGNFLNTSPTGPRGVTANRIPGTAVVPQASPQRPNDYRPAVRVDILGAEVAEDFKKAVREDSVDAATHALASKILSESYGYSAAQLNSSFDLPLGSGFRPFSDAAITAGSKSIVIVDDTFPSDYPAMTGALLPLNDSGDNFAGSFARPEADPTPPNTPPGRNLLNNPSSSSYPRGQHVLSPSLPLEDPLPPFVPDLATLGGKRLSEDTGTRPSIDRPSMCYIKQSPNRHPLTSMRYHKRQQSSRSFRSKRSNARSMARSVAHRRWASFQSVIPQSIKSFDATTYSEAASVASEVMSPPARMLRRRPGGDLRGVQNVAELDAFPLQRSRSVGSLTIYSESLRSSYLCSRRRDSCDGFVDVVSSDYSHNRQEVFSLGTLAEKTPQHHEVSLFTTHSSKPVMRPSFEAEAQKLAQIPDDLDDDGGVESALAKLEGKIYEKKLAKLPVSMQPSNESVPGVANHSVGSAADLPVEHPTTPEKEKKRHRIQHVGDEHMLPHGTEAKTRSTRHVSETLGVKSFLSGSQESYSSIPLLDRGLTDGGRSKTNTQWTNQSILQGPEDNQTPVDEASPSCTSFEFIQKTQSMDQIKPVSNATRSSDFQSFRDVYSDRDSDLSSELSLEVVESDDYAAKSARRPSTINTEIPTNVNAQAHRLIDDHPPSPPTTMEQVLQLSPETACVPQLHENQIWEQKSLPSTPDTTPFTAMYQQRMASPRDPTGTREAIRHTPRFQDDMSEQSSVHLPFILAFDSEVLAQQFTLIEKDALNEVDWKELIDMRWKNSHSDCRSWVDFLRNSDARGVEVVVARFNIMVKWTISEIVLTRDIEERARCIIKFLHIAAHCRKFRNFATMSQIALALTSNEVARLTKTWTMVPPHDLRTMQELETLVSPTKNFYNLRAEMEGGATTADTGCIPFVGIYTHDLLFNSQRPSEIASSPTTAPLVNFERCRIAASVVKTLLRLLEASTLYEFQPIEGITERCLWMTALNDDEIRRHSEGLEPSPV
ncbi:uncharacterized protein BCR38DRAFT_350162 [Pseudomassariella vexata]|uniref:Ras guanine nucleotide exchange factor domain-containing protein n=1 Tax=Pseudomassariella vexata TaxID=1141098 RepID=A0A1Y2DN24_9PEZI|nr:uncharacterized protein BCR38DRAFT_350162 [Pseudomassariella vexata]ORY60045.1 hypothetical protein BCR38DRAFT_350162 [Pseudomassariella vexata]